MKEMMSNMMASLTGSTQSSEPSIMTIDSNGAIQTMGSSGHSSGSTSSIMSSSSGGGSGKDGDPMIIMMNQGDGSKKSSKSSYSSSSSDEPSYLPHPPMMYAIPPHTGIMPPMYGAPNPTAAMYPMMPPPLYQSPPPPSAPTPAPSPSIMIYPVPMSSTKGSSKCDSSKIADKCKVCVDVCKIKKEQEDEEGPTYDRRTDVNEDFELKAKISRYVKISLKQAMDEMMNAPHDPMMHPMIQTPFDPSMQRVSDMMDGGYGGRVRPKGVNDMLPQYKDKGARASEQRPTFTLNIQAMEHDHWNLQK